MNPFMPPEPWANHMPVGLEEMYGERFLHTKDDIEWQVSMTNPQENFRKKLKAVTDETLRNEDKLAEQMKKFCAMHASMQFGTCHAPNSFCKAVEWCRKKAKNELDSPLEKLAGVPFKKKNSATFVDDLVVLTPEQASSSSSSMKK
eukprot:g7554.t1